MKPTAPALARTYSDREYPDPWEKVLDYRRVQEYAAEHPNHGRTRVGKALDLPPSRVRGWLKDGMPDSVRGIHTAIDHGWLDPDPESETAAALVDLLAHVLAGGSIKNQTYVPSVTVGGRIGIDDIQTAFSRVGVETVVRRADDDSRATEILPESNGSVLGRCLVTMGAPAGEKVGLDAFPSVVWEASESARVAFARTYIDHRATEFSDKRTIVLREERPPAYLEGLRDFLADVTGGPVTLGDRSVTVSADAARKFCPA
ncbi:hypothetical protein [Halorubrum distributum]|uniref:Uncharacterized protein n=1 Tax=Halorubrum distributum TaxID=29283 RepID=A0A6B1J0D3_9EURY|nr:hypothetical protein [Halorubrum terrestre]MYL69175.1 hypothetical protein [Halorubrum terrestre]